MPARKVDHKGKSRNPRSDAAWMYGLVRENAPLMKHGHAAHAVALYGKRLLYMKAPEMEAALAATELAWATATEAEKATAGRRAVNWESNPTTQEELAYFRSQAMEKAAMKLETWIEQAQEDRAFARGEHNPGVAHEATKTIGKALGHLDRETPSGSQPPPAIGQVNLNVIFADPDARRNLEAVVRRLESLTSGDSGQVVAGTVAQS